MAYSPTYTSDDVAPVVIDGGTKILVQIGVFATIFGLGLTLVFLGMIWKRIRK